MYKQICDILIQNGIPITNFLWTDETGSLQLNDKEPWTAFVEDTVETGILFYFGEDKRYYKITQQLGLGFTNIIMLEEVKNFEEETDSN